MLKYLYCKSFVGTEPWLRIILSVVRILKLIDGITDKDT